MVPTPPPPHFSGFRISKCPRKKPKIDSDRSRNSKNFGKVRFSFPRVWEPASKNPIFLDFSALCNGSDRMNRAKQNVNGCANVRQTKRYIASCLKTSVNLSKNEGKRATHRRHQNFAASQRLSRRSDLNKIFLRGYLLFDGQHDAVYRVDVFQAVSNRVWLRRKKSCEKRKAVFPRQ